MCTVTWLRRGDGYDLLFSRDELKTRAEALPPRESETDGVRWIAPVDPDGGGTWVATNEHGVTIGILNGFRAADGAPRAWTSRGTLAVRLASARRAGEAGSRLAALDLGSFRSFRLLAMSPDAPALVAEWDLRGLSLDADAEGRIPLVSSSFDESAVGAARRAEFARITASAPPTVERLLAFHRSTAGGPGPTSVAMERPEAATRSLTRVTVTPERVTQRYHPGRPDRPGPAVEVILARSHGGPR